MARTVQRFSPGITRVVDETKYMYLRAGSAHRFTAVWVVVVEGRVLVRSWNDKATGWYRAFLAERTGAMRLGEREVPVRARRVTSARLHDAMDAGYAAKYDTKASLTYVKGFATGRRRATTLELLPL